NAGPTMTSQLPCRRRLFVATSIFRLHGTTSIVSFSVTSSIGAAGGCEEQTMTKEEIAGALDEIATLLELKGENPFKVRAYTNAARSIDAWGASFSDLQNEETLEKIPGIGKAIAAKVKELATTGSLKFLEELRGQFPGAILDLFSIPGLGAKKIKALHEQLHVNSIADLQAACESGRVAELPGFGATTQEKLCKAI